MLLKQLVAKVKCKECESKINIVKSLSCIANVFKLDINTCELTVAKHHELIQENYEHLKKPSK